MGSGAVTGHRRHFEPMVYVVVWPDSVVKVGATCYVGGYSRWDRFVASGAKIAHLFSSGMTSNVNLEKCMRRAVAMHGTRAFADKRSAATHLGAAGAGYSECFMVPKHLLGHVLEHVLPSIAQRMGASNATERYVTERYEHTDGSGPADYLLTSTVQVSNSTQASHRARARGQHGEARTR